MHDHKNNPNFHQFLFEKGRSYDELTEGELTSMEQEYETKSTLQDLIEIVHWNLTFEDRLDA